MQDFTLPSNIKQIGSIGDGQRIYMEDYVCTFLQQYAEAAGFEERLAFLVGRQMIIDGQDFLFIGGAIYGRHVEKYEGHLRFTEKSVDYTEEMMEEHFPGMEIVGWMQSQPSYGTYLNQYYGAYHMRQFRKPFQVLFVMDPLERANVFYQVNQDAITPADRLKEISGYFIYYEKNTNMHEYMLTNKAVDYTAKPPTLVELTPLEYEKGDDNSELDEELDDRPRTDKPRFAFGAYPRESGGAASASGEEPEDVIRRHQAEKSKRRGLAVEQKRATNLLAGLCAVLFLVTFVMGVGLVRSQDRLYRMEGELRQLTTAFRNQLVQEAAGGATPVFAEALPGQNQQQEYPADALAQQAPVSSPLPTPSPTPEAQPTAAVPSAPGEQTALIPPVPETYEIQPGDSLWAISIYFFGTINMVDAILALNEMDDPDHIIAGRVIYLPPHQ